MDLDLVTRLPSVYNVISAIVVYIGVPILTILFVSFSVLVVFIELAERVIGFVSTLSFACIILPVTFAAHWAFDTIPLLILDGTIVLILCYNALIEKMQTIWQDQREKRAEEARKQEMCANIMDRGFVASLQTKIRLRKKRERKRGEDLQKTACNEGTRQRRDKHREDDQMFLRTAKRRMQWLQEEVVGEAQLEETQLAEAQLEDNGMDGDPRSTEAIQMSIRQSLDTINSFYTKQFSTHHVGFDQHHVHTSEQMKEMEEPWAEALGVHVRVDKVGDTMESHVGMANDQENGSATVEKAGTNWRQPLCEDWDSSEDQSYQRHLYDYLVV